MRQLTLPAIAIMVGVRTLGKLRTGAVAEIVKPEPPQASLLCQRSRRRGPVTAWAAETNLAASQARMGKYRPSKYL